MSARHSAPNVVCIFVKEPVAGEVKTRLAASIGSSAAARLANAFIEDTMALARRLSNVGVTIALSGSEANLPDAVRAFPILAQGDGDLGARLERSLRRCLTEASKAVVIGTDSPGLPLHLLHDAFAALAANDAVIGPALDGGFYLVGATECPEGMFEGVPWSTSTTQARTLASLRRAGMSVATIATWFDVDTAQDLEHLRRLLLSRSIEAPATARALGL